MLLRLDEQRETVKAISDAKVPQLKRFAILRLQSSELNCPFLVCSTIRLFKSIANLTWNNPTDASGQPDRNLVQDLAHLVKTKQAQSLTSGSGSRKVGSVA